MNREKSGQGEIYLEFQPVGRQVKVTAIDASTGIEVVVFGPSSVSSNDLKDLAVRKLMRRLEKDGQISPKTHQRKGYWV